MVLANILDATDQTLLLGGEVRHASVLKKEIVHPVEVVRAPKGHPARDETFGLGARDRGGDGCRSDCERDDERGEEGLWTHRLLPRGFCHRSARTSFSPRRVRPIAGIAARPIEMTAITKKREAIVKTRGEVTRVLSVSSASAPRNLAFSVRSTPPIAAIR